MVYMFVLQLENRKYYIEKSAKPITSIYDHYNMEGNEWTKKYKMVRLVKLIPNSDNVDEDEITIKYMKKYGINNVRGGHFKNIILRRSEINYINSCIDDGYKMIKF